MSLQEPSNQGDFISIKEAADVAHVSKATIRNWIKTGYLQPQTTKGITRSSLAHFMEHIVGTEKLLQRANKSKKDTHDHIALSAQVSQALKDGSANAVGADYENSLSNSYRNQEGIYYTPLMVVADMLRDITITDETTFLDPCCGSGNFLIQAIEMGIRPENIYGYDVDENAINITRKRIYEATGYESHTIRQVNFLEYAESLIDEGISFNYIFTNPPWGKKINKKKKQKYASTFGAGTSTDTSSLFFFAAINLLAEGGTLGFLVQEALFNIATFEDTRKKILQFQIERLVDYDRPFKGLMTKAQAFIIKNNSAPNHSVTCDTDQSTIREQSSFATNPNHILNFWVSNDAARRIDRLYAAPHITLADNATWAMGIVTGNNAKFCHDSPSDDRIPVYKGSDITNAGLKPASTFISSDLSRFQQVAALDRYYAPEKLMYKFISSRLMFHHDTTQSLILNSANILIPHPSLGISCQQLAALLNSETMNWLFDALFRTHKILRRDLEQLPIHVEYFEVHDAFSEDAYLKWLGVV